MKIQTKKLMEIILNADGGVSNVQKKQVMRILECKPNIPIKIYLTQQEVAWALSVSRQTVHSMVKQGILHPLDINGRGLMRYRLDELRKLKL